MIERGSDVIGANRFRERSRKSCSRNSPAITASTLKSAAYPSITSATTRHLDGSACCLRRVFRDGFWRALRTPLSVGKQIGTPETRIVDLSYLSSASFCQGRTRALRVLARFRIRLRRRSGCRHRGHALLAVAPVSPPRGTSPIRCQTARRTSARSVAHAGL